LIIFCPAIGIHFIHEVGIGVIGAGNYIFSVLSASYQQKTKNQKNRNKFHFPDFLSLQIQDLSVQTVQQKKFLIYSGLEVINRHAPPFGAWHLGS
jgi:hypothetical protein